jgi:DNA polymerase-3 subunit delta'
VWSVVGQDRAVALLKHGLAKGTVAHAYLLVGPPHVGKMKLAINLAQALNCESDEAPCGECISCQKIVAAKHPDVQIISLPANQNSAEAKPQVEIGIDQIREMQHSANLPPFEGKYKVFVVDGVELMSHEAANCLLKTLEEPVGSVVFVLLTTSDQLLPATVVSRCQRLELFPLTLDAVEDVLRGEHSIEPARSKLLARLCRGCLGWALLATLDESLLTLRAERIDRMLDIIGSNADERFAYATQMATQFSQNRGEVQQVLDLWLDWWRDLLLVKVGLSERITNVDRLAWLVDMAEGYRLAEIRSVIDHIQAAATKLRQNANPRLVLEVLMLDIPEGKVARYG